MTGSVSLQRLRRRIYPRRAAPCRRWQSSWRCRGSAGAAARRPGRGRGRGVERVASGKRRVLSASLVEGQRLRRALRLDVRPREAEDYAAGALRGDAHRASHAQRTELRCRPTRAALAGALGGHVGAEGAQRCAEGGSPGPHLQEGTEKVPRGGGAEGRAALPAPPPAARRSRGGRERAGGRAAAPAARTRTRLPALASPAVARGRVRGGRWGGREEG